ncbi:MAG: NHLP bacteriocin system secretion protein [Candidatus Eremiobacterota bacterium]
MPQTGLFREKALAKLSSPEQLDQLIIITDRKGWIALLAMGLIVITSLIWAFTAHLPVIISGSGILIAEGGLHEMVSMKEGIVKDVKVKLNDIVEENQVLARVANPEMEYELIIAKQALQEYKKESGEKSGEKIKELERNIKNLEEEIAFYSEIKSHTKGVITSVRVNDDDYVSKGTIIVTMENANVPLEAIIFISDIDAKTIQLGMDVQVSPSTVKKEDFGFIRGKITYISHYPSTKKRIAAILDNDQLTDYFMGKTMATFVARVSLQPDQFSKSGYKWSSKKEPDLKITSGTLCDASIIIKQISPISIVFPSIK